MYRPRVLGEFPEQSELSVYSLAWIEAASQEGPPMPADGKVRHVQVGIDVAGPGEDETVMAARVGESSSFRKRGRYPIPRGELALALSSICQRRDLQIAVVLVDGVVIGYHVATHLTQLIWRRWDIPYMPSMPATRR